MGPSFSAHTLDVTDQANINAVRDELNGAPLDVLPNNAGYIGGLDLNLNQTDDAE